MRILPMLFVLIGASGLIADDAGAQVAAGAKPRCVLSEWVQKTRKWEELWSGSVPSQNLARHQPWSLAAWRGGSADISSKHADALKPYAGRTTIHLDQ